MTPFIVSSNAVQLGTAAVDATDAYCNGLRLKADATLVRAATSGGAQFSNGLLLSNTGQIVYVDATAGLPANTQYTNGLPLSSTGALCVSTNAFATYSNGTPMAANGAVAVVITP